MNRWFCLLIIVLGCNDTCSAEPLAGTQPLDWEGDIASRLIDSADAFLLKKIEETLATHEFDQPDHAELARILGVVDERVTVKSDLEVLGKIAEGDNFVVHEIRWQAFGDVYGEGLWLAPPNACLLYTSPSPRDRFLSRMPSSA